MNFHNVEFERSFGTSEQLLESDMPEIVFSGRSNVGKSSMINKLFNRKNLARVSSMPGKTTTINFFRLEDLRFADLPGYGYAQRSKAEKRRWAELIESYFSSGRDIVLIFQLIDARHAPSADDLHMIDFMIENELPFVIIFTKTDKLSKRELQSRMDAFANEIPDFEQITAVPFSSVTGAGVEEIREIITEFSGGETGEE